MRPVVVLGTGMAAFGAGYALERERVPFLCCDKNAYIGGHTVTFERDGFSFDEGGHISFTKDERIRDLLAENVRGQFVELKLQIDNYWHGVRIRHPVQCNLNVLPPNLVVDILKDFFVASHRGGESAIHNYAEWLHAAYGKTFADTFPIVYGRKYHTIAADQMTTDWIGPRMYRPNLDEILHGALVGQKQAAHYVDTFRYPVKGGFMAYLRPFAERYDVRLRHKLIALDPRARVLCFENGVTLHYDVLISSIPLPDLISMIDGAPGKVREAARTLAFTTTVLVNLGVDRDDLSDTHIRYFYDEDIIFPRINFPHMFSPHNAPPGKGCIQAEVYFSDKYKPLRAPPESLVAPVVDDLRRCGILRENDVLLFAETRTIRYSNVIYDHYRREALEIVHRYLDEIGVHYCGRYGCWDHAWTDEAFKSGENAARAALASRHA